MPESATPADELRFRFAADVSCGLHSAELSVLFILTLDRSPASKFICIKVSRLNVPQVCDNVKNVYKLSWEETVFLRTLFIINSECYELHNFESHLRKPRRSLVFSFVRHRQWVKDEGNYVTSCGVRTRRVLAQLITGDFVTSCGVPCMEYAACSHKCVVRVSWAYVMPVYVLFVSSMSCITFNPSAGTITDHSQLAKHIYPYFKSQLFADYPGH